MYAWCRVLGTSMWRSAVHAHRLSKSEKRGSVLLLCARVGVTVLLLCARVGVVLLCAYVSQIECVYAVMCHFHFVASSRCCAHARTCESVRVCVCCYGVNFLFVATARCHTNTSLLMFAHEIRRPRDVAH